ncbi:MAG: hypothetical protein CMI01_17310 [Oceanospirillaceae bacterium]|nr:hypothetical protein [Oceanospirillaceae bacterium]
MRKRAESRLLALTILALLLFSPPLLLLFDRPLSLGFSALPVAIYLIWALVILISALILEGRHED